MRYKNNKNYLTFLRFQFVYISVWLWYWHVRQPYVSSTFEGRQGQNQDVVWYTLRPFRVEYLQEHFRYTWFLCNQLAPGSSNTRSNSEGQHGCSFRRNTYNNQGSSNHTKITLFVTTANNSHHTLKITPPNKQVLDYLHKLLPWSSHNRNTNLLTLTKNPLELILQVFPVVLALAYLFHQLLLRTSFAVLHIKIPLWDSMTMAQKYMIHHCIGNHTYFRNWSCKTMNHVWIATWIREALQKHTKRFSSVTSCSLVTADSDWLLKNICQQCYVLFTHSELR